MENTNQTPAQEPAQEVLPANNEAIPMLAPLRQLFGDIASGMVRSSEAQERIARAEKASEVAQVTITELREERSDLKGKVDKLQGLVLSLGNEVEQTKATLAYEKEQLVNTFRSFDELKAIHAALVKDHEHAADDRDLARLERDDWQDKHRRAVEGLDGVTAELASARRTWFEQENTMAMSISALTAERNMFRDKFDRAKSHAAAIMQLDRGGPDPIEQKFDA